MKKDKVKDKFLEVLESTPIIQVACEKSGISRTTYYRWAQEDPEFALLADQKRNLGVDLVNDYAESNVLNGIKKGDPGYTKYWLSSRHKEYRRQLYNKATVDLLREEIDREMAEKEAEAWQKMWEEKK
jgi:hypothetical protein